MVLADMMKILMRRVIGLSAVMASLLLPAEGQSEDVPRALPVDPSTLGADDSREIKPDNEEDAVKVVSEEVVPLSDGEVILPEHRAPAHADGQYLDAVTSRDDAVRLQIFLDQAGFGPGVIDGKPGRFTRLGLNAWSEAHGFPDDDSRPALERARREVPRPFARAMVPDVAREWVNPKLSYKRAEQAKAKRMSYRSYGEFMSERFHTDVAFLIELNDQASVYGAKPGDRLVVPNVRAFRIEAFGGEPFGEDPALMSRHLVLDTGDKQARIYESMPKALVVDETDGGVKIEANRALVASFPITPGREEFIRYGTWEMKNAVPFPYWRYDQQFLDTGKRSDEALNIPPGPNSPVGVIWMGLSVSGIGVHGTSDPETIGRSRSAGCIRMSNWNAARLPDLIRPGATVEIR